MNILIVILIILVGIVIGFYMGKIGSRLFKFVMDSRIKKGAKEVLSGKRDNKFELDGKMVDVHRFRLRDDNNQEFILDLTKNLQEVKETTEEEEEEITDKETFQQFQEFLKSKKKKKGKK